MTKTRMIIDDDDNSNNDNTNSNGIDKIANDTIKQ